MVFALGHSAGNNALAETAAPSVTVPPAPGVPVPGLRTFRLPADGSPGEFRLLVIPVRFPEDRLLGGGGETAIRERLADDSVNGLTGYFAAATGARLRLVPVLAPTVIADHPRSFYTSEGETNLGYGLDPGAYPHNAQFLAQEVTAKSAAAVDFRRFDNTGDGIADGLLLLHSGPPAPEAGGVNDRTVLLAHAFTLPGPVARGDTWVFPYAVASSSDGLGAWAHETGHLLGLPDLYVGNPFFPAEGVGEWSLMATGANAADGPTGLDAASLLHLGIAPVLAGGDPVSLAGGSFLRVFRAGEALGPEFFLIERRTGTDGLWIPEPATLVYRVNQRVGDNRNPSRPRVELLAAICAGDTPCLARLDDGTDPPLRDTAGSPTFLALDFTRDTVRTRYVDGSGLRLEAVRLQPEDGSGERRLIVTLHNDRDVPVVTTVEVALQETATVCLRRQGDSPVAVLPWEAASDSAWSLVGCSGGPVPAATVLLSVRFGAGAETLVVATGPPGLAASALGGFSAVNLEPGRSQPWARDAGTGDWIASGLDARADGVLVSPWFTVPDLGRLILDHAWNVTTLAPDYAEDALRVELELLTEPSVAIEPPGGWGFTAERGTGNALGGLSVLAGSGDRVHVIDLGSYARRTVRFCLRAAGDAQVDGGRWVVREASVGGPPSAGLALHVDAAGGRVRVGATGAVTSVAARIYAGAAPETPVALLAALTGEGAVPDPHGVPGSHRRYALVWRDAAGRGGEVDSVFWVPPRTVTELSAAFPNPAPAGAGQTWSIDIASGARPGTYHFDLLGSGGRRVAVVSAVFSEPGRRTVIWSGRDTVGRIVAPGVYFLRCTGPHGAAAATRVVVIP